VHAIRGALDLITFQRGADGRVLDGDDRYRDRARYCLDDAAKFAVHGQGHCHTVSSVGAAFLHPWQALLGFDLAYREDAAQRHQWLEVTLRGPRMAGFVVDLYRADGYDDPAAHLVRPVEEAYSLANCEDGWAPASKPKIMSGFPVEIVPIEPGDVDFESVRGSVAALETSITS
jgi:hypothetical protein